MTCNDSKKTAGGSFKFRTSITNIEKLGTIRFLASGSFCSRHIPKLELCTWTTSYGDALLEWLTRLRWPTEPDGTHDTTWFEMAFAFQTAIQHGLIYNSGGQGQGRFFLPKWAGKDDTTIRYGKQVLAFERCVGQLEKLLGRKLVSDRKSNCSTIMVLGANHYRPGLNSNSRPSFPLAEANSPGSLQSFCETENES